MNAAEMALARCPSIPLHKLDWAAADESVRHLPSESTAG